MAISSFARYTFVLGLSVGLWSSPMSVAAETTGANPLRIEIVNIESAKGALRLQILDSKAAFGGSGGSVAAFIVPAVEGSVELSLNSLPAGEYAIRVMQDTDGDGELGTNAIGMPNEPWGISNDAVGQFGPPSWSDAKFSLPETTQQTITLR
ncbi:MAG: DUF2141 domain-containing protein [Pseudomonadota bacterium]